VEYIVTHPMIVNGVRRRRGDVLSGADAEAVRDNANLHDTCVINPHVPFSAAAPAPSTPPAAPTKVAAPPRTTED